MCKEKNRFSLYQLIATSQSPSANWQNAKISAMKTFLLNHMWPQRHQEFIIKCLILIRCIFNWTFRYFLRLRDPILMLIWDPSRGERCIWRCRPSASFSPGCLSRHQSRHWCSPLSDPENREESVTDASSPSHKEQTSVPETASDLWSNKSGKDHPELPGDQLDSTSNF